MNSTSGRAWRRRLAVAVLATTSGVAGWALGLHGYGGRGPVPAGGVDAPVATALSASSVRLADAAMGSIADGSASVEVENAVAGSISCEPSDGDADAVDVEVVKWTLTEGTESERYAALTEALAAGINLPPELLWQTYASNLSASVRLLAFTTYVDSMSDDRAEVRAALQSAVYDGDSAVRNEAQRRLGELDQYERMLAEARAQGLPQTPGAMESEHR
jgi:hypothetical protein